VEFPALAGGDYSVHLPLQRADRPPGEASRRDRGLDQNRWHLRRLWLPCSVWPMRQGAGESTAWRSRCDGGAAGRRL